MADAAAPVRHSCRLLGLAALLLLAAPVAAIPPALGPPEEEYPLVFDEWKGVCYSRSGCYAKRPWGDGEIFVSIEEAQPYSMVSPHPARVRYNVRRPCRHSQNLDASLDLPIADARDVAAHLATAIQNDADQCRVPPLDEAVKASITRLVRLFTLAGGIAPPIRDGGPGHTDYNRHPINPDIWIDEVRDYPASARDRRQGGTVAVQLSVRDDLGRPVSCDVTESSGVAALDEATCALIMKNARFRVEPRPGISHYSHRVNWDISRVPVPFCVPCEIGPDGVRRQVQYEQGGRRIRRPGHSDEKPRR